MEVFFFFLDKWWYFKINDIDTWPSCTKIFMDVINKMNVNECYFKYEIWMVKVQVSEIFTLTVLFV